MELQKEHTNYIRYSFSKMMSKEDFLLLMNYVKKLLFGENTVPFSVKNLNYHVNPRLNNTRYSKFFIKKKSGGTRTISVPCKGLKTIQKCLNLIFQSLYTPNEAATGFMPGKSIVDNAKIHAGSYYVYNIDLKDFFPSIDQARIWGRLKYPPYSLTGTIQRERIAGMIASLCCVEMDVERLNADKKWEILKKNVLPQGSPTSPVLSNIICQRLDEKLLAIARKFNVRYSRYADDITFSSSHNVYQENSNFINNVTRIITDQNFTIKEDKTRLQKQDYQQQVTGLVVNKQPNVGKRYVKQLRMWMYYWEHYGYEKASRYFLQNYLKDKGHINASFPDMKNVIAGKLDYLKMVKGVRNTTYKGLKKRFQILSTDTHPIASIVALWETENIETAAHEYMKQFPNVITMTSNKIDFISNLLAHKKLAPQLKEKIFNLSSEELKRSGMTDEAILKRLEMLEAKISTLNPPVNISIEESKRTAVRSGKSSSKTLDLRDPKIIPIFLNEFNQNIILKSTTHLIDGNLLESLLSEMKIDEYDYTTHIKHIKSEFNKLYKQHKISSGLNGKLNSFLLNSKQGWSEDKITLGWASPEIKLWCEKNPGKCPNPDGDLKYAGCSFQTRIELKNGKQINNFNELITYFKKQIEFRDDAYLENIISTINRELRRNAVDKYPLRFDENGINKKIRFYTDVEKVIQAYRQIVNICIKHWEESHENNEREIKISIDLNESTQGKETVITLGITDVNSVFGKTVKSTRDRYGADLHGLIANQINGLCDLSLCAEFPDKQFASFPLWPKTTAEAQTLSFFKGVRFELKFFRIS